MTPNKLTIVLRVVSSILFANSILFGIEISVLGGAAINGVIRDGHYFLVTNGRLTGVGADVYTYVLWHERIVLATYPLMMLSFWLAQRLRKRSTTGP